MHDSQEPKNGSNRHRIGGLYDRADEVSPKIWMIVLIGVVSIAFTITWMIGWMTVSDVIWSSDFVGENTWITPVLVVAISFFVGVCIKYLHASTMITGGPTESMEKGDVDRTDFKSFWGTLPSSVLSLISGVGVGPEGSLALLTEDISGWIAAKLRIVKESRFGFTVAGLASAYNGIVGSPVFAAVFATEVQGGKEKSFRNIAWNLLAGAIGFMIYYLLGFQAFLGSITFPDIDEESLWYLLYAVLLGLAGAFIALYAGAMFSLFGKLMDRFRDKVILRTLVAGSITGIVVYLVPEVMFSGEEQIHDIISEAADYGIAMLLLFAVLKIILLALALKGGFIGGPIFPVLFSCTMVALALSLAFPDIPLIILVLCIEAAAVAFALKAPLTAILLVTVVAASTAPEAEGVTTYILGLIVISTVTSMIVGSGIGRLMKKDAGEGDTPSRTNER